MQYGSPEWQGWVLGEEQAMEHIKAAYDALLLRYPVFCLITASCRYDAGIQTFDTADVRYFVTASSGLTDYFF
jgi:hypothetical protein